MTLEGKRALVTGGSAGLGYAAALEMAAKGARVGIVARNADQLRAAADRIHAETGSEVVALPGDVKQAEVLASIHQALEARWGGIDILINNAGGSSRGSIDTLTDEQWQSDFDVKFFSALRLSRLVMPGMKARRWGRILNVLNTLAKAPEAGSAPTSVTRAAGLALTKVLAHELAPFNVLVNALCVGRIESDQWLGFHKRDAPDLPYASYLEQQGREIPLGRLGHPAEFAGLVGLLVSDAGGYITGAGINIDGGLCPAV